MDIEDKIKIIVSRVCDAYGMPPVQITPKITDQLLLQEEADHVMEGELLLICDMIELYLQSQLSAKDLDGRLPKHPYKLLSEWPLWVAVAKRHKKLIARRRAIRDTHALKVEHMDDGISEEDYPLPRVKLSEVAELNRGRPDYQEPSREDWAEWRRMVQCHKDGVKYYPDPNWWGAEEFNKLRQNKELTK